jgi:hypothetical protein
MIKCIYYLSSSLNKGMHLFEPEVINRVIITVHVSNITLEYCKYSGVHTTDTKQVCNLCLLMSNLCIRILFLLLCQNQTAQENLKVTTNTDNKKNHYNFGKKTRNTEFLYFAKLNM